MARGTTVFRIRIEVIFRQCWNLITPSPVVQEVLAQRQACGVSEVAGGISQ
jgi:hypothetical protein